MSYYLLFFLGFEIIFKWDKYYECVEYLLVKLKIRVKII